MSDMTVSRIILEQLGGRRFLAMTGAKNLVGSDNSLSMHVNGSVEAGKVSGVRITLESSDTYTVESYFFRGTKITSRHKETLIYNDMLAESFTRATGLYTSLGTMKGR